MSSVNKEIENLRALLRAAELHAREEQRRREEEQRRREEEQRRREEEQHRREEEQHRREEAESELVAERRRREEAERGNQDTDTENVPRHARVPSHASSTRSNLQEDWTKEYYPPSLDALHDLIQRYQRCDISQYYARTLVFVQSSGMGKSRLADAFGQTCPMINFILRDYKANTGFPPTDTE